MPTLDRLEAAHLRSVVVGYRDALRTHQERLNGLNVYPVPDGDTGTNMALTLESVVKELSGVEVDGGGAMSAVCRAISHGSLMGARGNSGVILSQILRGLTDRLKDAESADGQGVAQALVAASDAAYEAVMRPVEGTILTVVRRAAEAAGAAAGESSPTLVKVLDAAADAGADALSHTPEQLPVLAQAGVVDAGGAGFLLLLQALLQVVDDRPVPAPDPSTAGPDVGRVSQPAASEGDELRYEVMFLLDAPDDALAGFKRAWAEVGDSIVVVGGNGIWNCHIHTNDIGAALEAGVDAGRPRRIQVTDLAEQVEEEGWVREATTPPAGAAASAPSGDPSGSQGKADDGQASASASGDARRAQATAVVAVGAGDGAVSILRSLGVDTIVAGGQSMNPSTAELLEAIEGSSAGGVVLLPNNKNVIPVAERAAELAGTRAGRPVRVVPTHSLAEGFAAMMGFHAESAPDANAEAMAEAADRVRWGEVTWAVRDATTEAGPVTEGDHLGLLGHDIVAAAPDLGDAACELLERLVDDGCELVTVVEGEAASEDATGRITEWLAKHYPDVAVEVHRGDQPLSAYLFSAE